MTLASHPQEESGSKRPYYPEIGGTEAVLKNKDNEIERLAQSLAEAKKDGRSALENAEEFRKQLESAERRIRSLDSNIEDLRVMVTVFLKEASRQKDSDTGNHIERVGLFAGLLAQRMQKDEEFCRQIQIMAIPHDIGKLATPDRIIQKPAGLTPDEYQEMRGHTTAGADSLSVLGPRFDMARQIARSHHENWDGSGYPDKLVGESIPLPARIVRIVDAFDAMAYGRVYQAPIAMNAVMKEFRAKMGMDFDPALTKIWIKTIKDSGVKKALEEAGLELPPKM